MRKVFHKRAPRAGKLLALGTALACAATAWAETEAVWSNLTAESGDWGAPANWTDGNGTALTVAPTNAASAYAITVPDHQVHAKHQVITTGALIGGGPDACLGDGSVDPSVVSVTGGPRTVIVHPGTPLEKREGYQHQPIRTFSIDNPNGFEGFWESRDLRGVWRLNATASFVPTMSSVSVYNRVGVEVPTAGTTARINHLYSGGTLEKTGAGRLELGLTSGRQHVYLKEGTLSLDGDFLGLDAVIAKAAVHLDASATNTITTSVDGDGLDAVQRWDDVRRNGAYAEAPTYAYPPDGAYKQHFCSFTRPGFLLKNCSPTALPMVSFGASKPEQVARLGPTNCVLKMNRDLKGVRTAIYVAHTPVTGSGCTILGDDGTYHFASEGSKLFAGTTATSYTGKDGPWRTVDGEILFNGVRKDSTDLDAASTTNAYVMCLTPTNVTEVGLLGRDRYYMARSGGSRLGEVLLFTNSLTRTERAAIVKHLMAKWTAPETALTLGSLLMSGGTTVEVPEGRTARIATLVAVDGKIIKTGGGTLVVDAVYPDRAKIEVRGGDVRFTELVEAVGDEPAPAANPHIWLDANKNVTYAEVDGVNRVSSWGDCRDGVTATATAVCNTNNAAPLPALIANAQNGMPAIDLGLKSAKTHSYFTLPDWANAGNRHIYAGFVVRKVNSSTTPSDPFGSSDMSMFRSSTVFSSTTYRQPPASTATWRLNGTPCDPWVANSDLTDTSRFYVIGFSGTKPTCVDAIAKDRKNQQWDSCGDMQVAEFILYDRPISEVERRRTESYLMKKWLGEDGTHAAANGVSLGAMTFADDVDTVIDSDVEITPGFVVGGSGNVVKRGTGTAEMTVAPCDTLAVDGGTLNLEISLEPKAIFHFDASQTNTFTTYTGEDGRTFITRWDDVSTNGLYAYSMRDSYYYRTYYKKFVMTNPVLTRVTMPDGLVRPVVDFGGYRNTSTQQESGTNAASLFFTRDITGRSALTLVKNVREIYVVQKYNPDVNLGSYAHFIGNMNGGAVKAVDGSLTYMRGGNALFSTTYTSLRVQNGYLAVDREVKAANATLPSGWHLMSVGATDVTTVDSMMQDRDCNAGGGYIAEMIAFGGPLTAAERASLEQKLMRKWGIGNESAPTQTVSGVTVAADAALNLVDMQLKTGALGGDGAITVDSMTVTDGGALAFEYRAADDVDQIAVDGALAFDGAVTVRVSAAAGAVLAPGEWCLLTATGGITGLDASTVTPDISLPSGKWAAKVFVRDGALWLRISPRGTAIILR